MYTKPETFYIVSFRKSPKSYRANNYDTIPYEFRTPEDAKKYIEGINSEKLALKYCEAIIVEYTNKPVGKIIFQNN